MMVCDFMNCEKEALTCGNVICYSKDGDYDNVCLCKRHISLLVPKKIRGTYIDKIDKKYMINRLRRIADLMEADEE